MIAAATGATFLLVANVVTGQHAHGNWPGPAKLIGALLLIGPVYLTVLALARTAMQRG